jgi:hypothetical protein
MEIDIACILESFAELIEENGWTLSALARYGNGKECDPSDPRAKCFCAEGKDKIWK